MQGGKRGVFGGRSRVAGRTCGLFWCRNELDETQQVRLHQQAHSTVLSHFLCSSPRSTRKFSVDQGVSTAVRTRLMCLYTQLSSKTQSDTQTVWKKKRKIKITAELIKNAERRLNIQKPEDWITVTLADLKEIGLPRIKKPRLASLLSKLYPDHSWDKVYLQQGRYAQQRRFEQLIADIFPSTHLLINARRQAGLRNPESNSYMELDIYLPTLRLAFEYQEKHHYASSQYSYQPVDYYTKRDEMKKKLAEEKGITLMAIPCWWDGRRQSLEATIKSVRPDLLKEVVTDLNAIIPSKPPLNFMSGHKVKLEDIGEPITACFFTMSNVDPKDWWMFEKYDGVRGFWNPLKKCFYSRNGKKLTVSKDVIKSMPTDAFLDGELWFGREGFQDAMAMVNRHVETAAVNWRNFKYMVFDIPNHSGTYQERYTALVNYVSNLPGKKKYLEVAKYEQCTDVPHLERFYQDVVDNGGEGVILRDPSSPYQPGRSPGYLKLKKFRDAEAKVISLNDHNQWECELPNGVRFIAPAGTTEFLKRWRPVQGDIVTFKHRGFMLGTLKPKMPTIYRVRSDLTWEDVVHNWKEKKLPSIKEPPLKRSTPNGFWQDDENCKRFLVNYAKHKGFDPEVAANWEKVSYKEICSFKGSRLLREYKGLTGALAVAFPTMQLNSMRKPRGFWLDEENRRTYFLHLAKRMKFDPLDPNNWKKVTNEDVKARQGGGLLRMFNDSLKKALASSIPELKGMDAT